MSIILTGAIATEIVRAGTIADEHLNASRCDQILREAVFNRAALRELRHSLTVSRVFSNLKSRGLALVGERADECNPRFHVVLPRHGHERPTKDLAAYYSSIRLSADSLLRVDPALQLRSQTFVTSPALSWILASSHVDDIGALEHAMELCGTYAIAPDGTLMSGLNPVTTRSELIRHVREFADANDDHRVAGLKRALTMAAFVLGNSASPMETKVAIMLSLPVMRGGWGISNLVLNQRFDLDDGQRSIAQKPYLVIDGCTADGRLGYEYDSRAFHDLGGAEYRDRVRLAAAQCLGLTLLPLTTDVVLDERRCEWFFDEFARLAGKLPRKLGKRTLLRRRGVRRKLGLPVSEWSAFEDVDVPLEAYGVDL